MLFVTGGSYLGDLSSPDDDKDQEEGQEWIDTWAEVHTDSDDNSLDYVAQHNLVTLEQNLSSASCVHSANLSRTRSVSIVSMHAFYT